MAFTKLEPSSVNTSATFTFADISAGNVLTDHILYSNGSPYTFTTTAAGLDTQIQFNDNGSFAGSPNLVYNKVTKSLSTDIVLVSGNITSNNAILGNLVTANYFTGNGALLSGITGSNVTGSVPTATVAATVTTNAQPNITSVGTLANLTVVGTTNVGAVTNLKITGGLTNQVLTTDGLGNLSWTAGGGGGSGGGGAGFITVTKDVFTADGTSNSYTLSITPSSSAYVVVNIDGIIQQLSSYSLSTNVLTISGMPAAGEIIEITSYGVGGLPGGSDTQVQFNSSGVFQGAPSLTFNSATSTLSASNITGNLVTATQANVTSLGTLTSLTVSGLSTFKSSQDVTVSGTPTGTVNYDIANGVVFDVTPSASWTANIGNVPTTTNRTTVVTFIITQGATPYVPSAMQVNGVSQTVKWLNNTAPSGNANKVDIISYSLIRSSAGGWTVLGQTASYG